MTTEQGGDSSTALERVRNVTKPAPSISPVDYGVPTACQQHQHKKQPVVNAAQQQQGIQIREPEHKALVRFLFDQLTSKRPLTNVLSCIPPEYKVMHCILDAFMMTMAKNTGGPLAEEVLLILSCLIVERYPVLHKDFALLKTRYPPILVFSALQLAVLLFNKFVLEKTTGEGDRFLIETRSKAFIRALIYIDLKEKFNMSPPLLFYDERSRFLKWFQIFFMPERQHANPQAIAAHRKQPEFAANGQQQPLPTQASFARQSTARDFQQRQQQSLPTTAMQHLQPAVPRRQSMMAGTSASFNDTAKGSIMRKIEILKVLKRSPAPVETSIANKRSRLSSMGTACVPQLPPTSFLSTQAALPCSSQVASVHKTISYPQAHAISNSILRKRLNSTTMGNLRILTSSEVNHGIPKAPHLNPMTGQPGHFPAPPSHSQNPVNAPVLYSSNASVPTASLRPETAGLKVMASKKEEFGISARHDGFQDFTFPTSCNFCSKAAEELCSNCKSVAYCNRVCQVNDWESRHKNECHMP